MQNKKILSRSKIIMLMEKSNLSQERSVHSIQVADLALQLSDAMISDRKIIDKTIIE